MQFGIPHDCRNLAPWLLTTCLLAGRTSVIGAELPQLESRPDEGEGEQAGVLPWHLLQSIRERTGIGKDLHGNIPADRPLALEDLDVSLRFSNFLIEKQGNIEKREVAAELLGILGHRTAIPALLAVMRDREDERQIRIGALQALSQIHDKRVVPYLIEAVGEESLNEMANWQLELITKRRLPHGAPDVAPEPEATFYTRQQQDWRKWWEKNKEEIELDRMRAFSIY